MHAKLFDGCYEFTYLDPTESGEEDQERKITIDAENSIVSTHVHGIEVRPAFDGNPLSWFSNKGDRGVGFLSFEMDYFEKPTELEDRISDIVEFFLKKTDGLGINFKVNVYPNVQQPGTFWYHDHAMSNTRFNVGEGLFGFYIIRDPVAE